MSSFEDSTAEMWSHYDTPSSMSSETCSSDKDVETGGKRKMWWNGTATFIIAVGIVLFIACAAIFIVFPTNRIVSHSSNSSSYWKNMKKIKKKSAFLKESKDYNLLKSYDDGVVFRSSEEKNIYRVEFDPRNVHCPTVEQECKSVEAAKPSRRSIDIEATEYECQASCYCPETISRRISLSMPAFFGVAAFSTFAAISVATKYYTGICEKNYQDVCPSVETHVEGCRIKDDLFARDEQENTYESRREVTCDNLCEVLQGMNAFSTTIEATSKSDAERQVMRLDFFDIIYTGGMLISGSAIGIYFHKLMEEAESKTLKNSFDCCGYCGLEDPEDDFSEDNRLCCEIRYTNEDYKEMARKLRMKQDFLYEMMNPRCLTHIAKVWGTANERKIAGRLRYFKKSFRCSIKRKDVEARFEECKA